MSDTTMQLPPKSRLAYILLAFFLGGFGVHNFYAGYTKKGTWQLILMLLLGWTIIVPFIIGICIIVEMCTVSVSADGRPMV